MIESIATVVAVGDTWAQVECRRKSACGHCHQQESCGVGTIAKAMPGRPQLLEIILTAPVQVGQQVRIGIPERSLLTSAMLVYLVPLLFLLLGSLAGKLVSVHWPVGEEPSEIVGALLGGALGFWLARLGAKRLGGNFYRPVMLGLNIPAQQTD
jgi:sigma-E factor negative regulatory protein RseC